MSCMAQARTHYCKLAWHALHLLHLLSNRLLAGSSQGYGQQVPLGLLVHLLELIPLPLCFPFSPVPPSAVFRCLVNNIGSLGNGCAAEVARGAYTGLTFWSFVSGHSA